VKPDEAAKFQKRIGARVRELRTEREISQEAFADLCSLHRTHVSLLERGRVNITMNTLKAILNVLGMKASEFFKGLD
jgi:transcriptional regulator with XRE-family HTH domain